MSSSAVTIAASAAAPCPRTQHPHRRAHQRPRAQHPPAPCLRTVAPLHRSTRTRQRRRPPRPFCRCRYPLCCSPQRRYPPCRPIKPRIPSLRCGGPRAQLARIAPYASPFPRMRAISPLPGSIFASCMLFGVKMTRSSPHVSISGCDRAVLDAWRGNLAVKGGFSRRGGPRSCMARRTCQRCSTSSWQRPVVCSNGLCALSPIPGLLDAWVHPCNPGRAHRYHALPPACDRRTACALPMPHPHPRSACRFRYRVPSGSRPGDVAPWRYRPQPAIASRRTACVPPACDRHRSRYLAPRRHPRCHLRRTHAAPVPPRARHPPHLAPPRGPRCSSGNSREMVR